MHKYTKRQITWALVVSCVSVMVSSVSLMLFASVSDYSSAPLPVIDTPMLVEEDTSLMDDFATVIAEPTTSDLHEAPSVDSRELPVDSPSEKPASGGSDLSVWELRKAYTISIPDIGVRAPVLLPSRSYWDAHDWPLLEEQMQVGLLYGTVAYPHSAVPGTTGTTIIAGHSSPPNDRASQSAFSSVFAQLPDLTSGQKIIITDGDQVFTYIVTESFIVSAADTSILALQDEGHSMLTIITCYPVGSTRQRFVLRAERVED